MNHAPTPAERARVLVGDELVPEPMLSDTHAASLSAPPSRVWPWLVQMGGGRGGWYSYDLLDNRGVPSARRIVPELQQLEMGDVVPAYPGATSWFRVADLERERRLVLSVPGAAGARATWALYLEPEPRSAIAEGGDAGTRLLVRLRVAPLRLLGAPLPRFLVRPILSLGHGFMQRRQLNGLRARTNPEYAG